MKKKGTSMVLIDSAGAGDIVSIAGLAVPSIGHTVANAEVQKYTQWFLNEQMILFIKKRAYFLCASFRSFFRQTNHFSESRYL